MADPAPWSILDNITIISSEDIEAKNEATAKIIKPKI